jgi:quercetin dioxygenase-like cupin family protein
MPVVRASARPTKQAPASNFTGTVYQDEIVVGTTPSRMRASVVSFTPGARTAWHAHPVGQTLYCLSGVGRICFKGEKPQRLNPGDTVMIPPGVLHWHGAAPDRLFAHLAMSENSDAGAGTSWGEHVSDGDYAAPVS